MSLINEALEGLDILNESEDELMCLAVLKTDGMSITITWLGFRLWYSDDDERKFCEKTNSYEPFGKFLIRKQKECYKEMKSEMSKRFKQVAI